MWSIVTTQGWLISVNLRSNLRNNGLQHPYRVVLWQICMWKNETWDGGEKARGVGGCREETADESRVPTELALFIHIKSVLNMDSREQSASLSGLRLCTTCPATCTCTSPPTFPVLLQFICMYVRRWAERAVWKQHQVVTTVTTNKKSFRTFCSDTWLMAVRKRLLQDAGTREAQVCATVCKEGWHEKASSLPPGGGLQ